MRYLITGHTGFKGSWLSALLKIMGNEVYGIALNPEPNSLFNQSNIKRYMTEDLRIDIRDFKLLNKAISSIDPEVIIHLAAQPLVRLSYLKPLETFETNVMGTLNLLEATKQQIGRAHV